MLKLTIIYMMFLAQALNTIHDVESNIDRQRVLAKTLKSPEKLAKTILRIEFLTACRKYNVVPKFIEDALKPINKIFSGNNRIQNRSETFAATLLNEAIAESFRHKAFLERRRVTLKREVSLFLTGERLAHIAHTCNQVFDITIRENRPRLVTKFNRRQQDKDNETDDTAADDTEQENGNGPSLKRVNNLSSLVLNKSKLSILSKGPNFAIAQSITKDVLLEVEKSVERLAYAKRWIDDISRRKRHVVPQETGGDPTSDEGALQHPGAPRTDESTAEQQQHVGGTTTEQVDIHSHREGTTRQQDNSDLGGREERGGDTTGQQLNDDARVGGEGDTAGRQSEVGGRRRGDERHTSRGSVRTLNFNFPDICKRFPPPATVDVERSLHKLKLDVVRTYKSHKTEHCNVTTEEKAFIKELSKNKEVIVKQSDKCKGLVLLDRNDYKEKVDNIVSDPEKYEKLRRNPVPRVEAKTKQVFKAVSRNKLPDRTIDDLTPMHSRTPVFYGLPKDHKPDVPLRPVVSGSGGPTEKTACLLETILKQLLAYIPTHLSDTKDFLTRTAEHCRSQPLPEHAMFFSIDVVNLYGSIPVEEAIDAAKDKLETHCRDIETFGLSLNDICTLLDQCLVQWRLVI